MHYLFIYFLIYLKRTMQIHLHSLQCAGVSTAVLQPDVKTIKNTKKGHTGHST